MEPSGRQAAYDPRAFGDDGLGVNQMEIGEDQDVEHLGRCRKCGNRAIINVYPKGTSEQCPECGAMTLYVNGESVHMADLDEGRSNSIRNRMKNMVGYPDPREATVTSAITVEGKVAVIHTGEDFTEIVFDDPL